MVKLGEGGGEEGEGEERVERGGEGGGREGERRERGKEGVRRGGQEEHLTNFSQSQTARAEIRIISCSTEIHRRYQDHGYTLGCTVGETLEDCWNVDEDRELSDAWTSSTRFTIFSENHWMDLHGPEGD